MTEFYPLVVIGAVIGVLSLVFITVYYYVRSREEKKDHDRKMSDRVIIRRLLGYARPYIK